MVTAVLFDLDGTLAHTDPIHYQVWAELLENHGITLTPHFYQHHISGRQNRCLMADLFPHWALEEVDRFAHQKEALFRQRAQQLQPLPGALAFLQRIHSQGWGCALVTNAPRANTEFMVEILGLGPWLALIILGEEAPAPKPDPAPYQLALERLGVTADQAIAFEDSPPGIRAATGAGIPTIGLTTSHSPQDLRAMGAIAAIEDFEQVAKLAEFTDLFEGTL